VRLRIKGKTGKYTIYEVIGLDPKNA